ncbi:MAG: hypothetical protein EOS72_03165 [Mesorhizobium sp.]|uniref:hypothetical protein n=1 Tax=Mesorhizobium sp. TaxID=1871066 RepID=UPI000FE86B1E|nr:hypothetical protein [Mesorhizobium sp.]RWC91669.1 MAG: hypothetical protein EOS72_03165 [Mesorhizobium sp.]
MRLITKERAFAIASQWGSFMHATDPGQCLYAFYVNDGRPLTEAHRLECLRWLRSKQTTCRSDREYDELMKLIRFMANTALRPN